MFFNVLKVGEGWRRLEKGWRKSEKVRESTGKCGKGRSEKGGESPRKSETGVRRVRKCVFDSNSIPVDVL